SLGIGTLDKISWSNQLEYVRKLTNAGVPVHANVVIRAGHGGLRNASDIATDALLQLVDGTSPKVTPGVDYYQVDRATQTDVPFTLPDGQIPFTMEAPWVAFPGSAFSLVFAGEPGTQYELQIVPSGGGTAIKTVTRA